MDTAGMPPDLTSLYMQELGTLLFAAVFLFLYRQSRVLYFGLWSIAWALRCAAAVFGFVVVRTAQFWWLAPYAAFEFAFAMVLVAAARTGFASNVDNRRATLRTLALLPVLVVLVLVCGSVSPWEGYYVCHALLLGLVYFCNFTALRRSGTGIGARFFRFSLLLLSVASVLYGALLLYLFRAGIAPAWTYLHQETNYGFLLHAVVAFAAMAMWSESQVENAQELVTEVDLLRRESQSLDVDHLTGLFNQAALARRVEQAAEFPGVVAVCDMDNFKDVNDRYGHLTGDEILRNIGSLLRASIRHEDEAYRWGGDEFVVLFHNQRQDVVDKRMADVELRLRDFHVRGVGTLPISFSWGTADAHDRPLLEALDAADRQMYTLKRERWASPQTAARGRADAHRERPPRQ